MLIPDFSRKDHPFPSMKDRTLRYQDGLIYKHRNQVWFVCCIPSSVVSVVVFSPEYFRRLCAPSVRWYAIIIERLLPSPSPECQCTKTSLFTQTTLWDLSGRSGLFPSRPWIFAPKVCPPMYSSSAFGVSLDFVKFWAPGIQQVLYLREETWIVYLHRFRGEPAIPRLD